MEIVKCSDWDRWRVEYMDRGLCTIVDSYNPLKMKEAISWCWQEGAIARNGPESHLRTAADFLIGMYFHSWFKFSAQPESNLI